MKRPAAWLFLILAATVSASAQYYFDYPTYKRFAFGLHGGAAFPLLKATTSYQDHWNDLLLISVTEVSNIEMKAKAGLLFGVHCTYFFNPSMGIRLEAGPRSWDVPTSTDVTFSWTWADGRRFQSKPVWKGAGRATTLPIDLDFIWKRELGRHEWFVSGGLSYYRHTFRAESSFGYGISTLSSDGSEQYIDALRIGLSVPEMSWTSFGFNAGLGLNIKLSEFLGFQVEAGYFYSPQKRSAWTFVKTDYDGVFFSNIKGIDFNDGDIQFLTGGNAPKMKTGLSLNPSFIRLAVGLVLFLGNAEY